jgi:predicted CXXCH cytochrome family protein
VVFLGFVATALAAVPPHVPDTAPTDSCAMCHRAHTADAVVPYRSSDTTETTGTSLLMAPDPTRGDVSLCLTCHGVGQLGSNSDVESAFARVSVHSLAPSSAPYGPNPLYCSSCHDAHGTDRTTSGTPYPALLRSYEGTQAVFTGEQYCATCHTVQPGERWDGLQTFAATGHFSGISMPGTGTGIRCSVCHDPHGSSVAPLLVASLVPTSVASTFTVNADDRTFCIACHPGVSATWSGETTYALSAHALSSKTVTITARWVPEGRRKVGECQVCHAPMGRSNGAGGAIPKLLDASGRVLCDRCHTAGGVASADTSSQARPLANALTLAVVSSPASPTAWAGRVALYGRVATGPGQLAGPREYAVPDGTGPSAAGDVDGDGISELVVASADSPVVTVLRPDPLTGLGSEPTTYAIPAGSPAVALAIANVVADLTTSAPELVIVSDTGDVVLYRVSGSVLSTVAGPVPTGGDGPWGLATGDTTGTARPDVVVTNRSAGTLTILTDDGFFGSVATTARAGIEPVAPSIGHVWRGATSGQIVVCDAAAAATATVRVLDGSGTVLPGAEYLVRSGAGIPSASAVGDVLWSVPASDRAELAVAFTEASGDSSVAVIPQVASGPGLDVAAAIERSTGVRARTGSALVADVDSDGRAELVVGNGGTWARDASAQAPDIRILRANGAGDDLASGSPEVHVAGGAELAGGTPSLVLADFGRVLPSRHPIDESAPSAHVSTETASVARHVTCADCHDSHEAAVKATTAPSVQGLLAGSWGVSVDYSGGVPSFSGPARSDTSYGVCFKCHSSYVDLGGRPDVAAQVDPSNASVHAIVRAATSTVAADTFVAATPAWTASSVLYCTDCHGDDGRGAGQARGIHESDAAPILAGPYEGVASDDPALLCYDCHRRDVYAQTADAPGLSSFSSGALRLHSVHVAAPADGGHGVSCGACHVTHGSVTLPHLLRGDIGFVKTGSHAGTCRTACHTPPLADVPYGQ